MRSFIKSPSTWALLTLSLLPSVLGSPLFEKRAKGPWLGLNTNFPDPSFMKAADNKWYAFGTNGNGKRVQVAVSDDFKTWKLLDIEALPTLSTWETENDHWAPDVVMRDDGKYVMYYSGEAKSNLRHHCVGTAVADKPTGPYVPSNKPLSCRLDRGGSIDPAGFKDKDGSRYVVFKVDGNSVGHGGDCNNGVEPLVSTPVLLQKVAADGVTPIGDAVQILDRNTADGDGPLVEAPNLILHGDTYFLFYSTHCFTDPAYDVRWATSKSITGPYTKTNVPLINAANTGLISPGGGNVCGCGDRILFHGFCTEERTSRCMYAANVIIEGTKVSIA
ncbi:Glycoside hydrolase family 43 [Penicillium concentricum]|uniref:Glycoside hydrolase family 43 n=1 Tax=Penicillium concentricum TaxID=293559 RepID=A0A9W9S455_9EURO|nr:Glycoside hydrolase family 43 [Penicillium concentricum]KAJ5371671.1 Glycoside hydrolase family 43 [Penicillium concentricum]